MQEESTYGGIHDVIIKIDRKKRMRREEKKKRRVSTTTNERTSS
jgi:hypothetical protein